MSKELDVHATIFGCGLESFIQPCACSMREATTTAHNGLGFLRAFVGLCSNVKVTEVIRRKSSLSSIFFSLCAERICCGFDLSWDI